MCKICRQAKQLSRGDAYQLVGGAIVGADKKTIDHLMSFLDELEQTDQAVDEDEEELDVSDYLAYEHQRQGRSE